MLFLSSCVRATLKISTENSTIDKKGLSMAYDGNKTGCIGCCEQEPRIWHEFMCHVPYTVISLAVGFALASILHVIQAAIGVQTDSEVISEGYEMLFHVFHYLHIVFAVMGTTVTFFRYSHKIVRGVLVSLAIPAFFCMLSDSVLPSVAGSVLGIDIHLHVCLFHVHDAINMAIFLLAGLAVGASVLQHTPSLQFLSYGSHFFHIFCSSLASLFYIVSHGFTDWANSMGLVFVSLFIAVIVPCTLSDVVVPLCCVEKSAHKSKE